MQNFYLSPINTFRHPWRSYQSRVLDHLDHYRADRSVHIVAPPGAGKTVLGLEIVRRLEKRALILVPSLTIRAQWAERWTVDFGGDPAGISHRLDRPAGLTIVTYQAVYQQIEREGPDTLPGYELLLVDECHHLRREWWRVLNDFRKRYDPELVALTATPPYDVSGLEWRRYRNFCGEIDEEISVPELVAAGDLCPHQDYLYPILPPAEEAGAVADRKTKKAELLALARTRGELALYLYEHPWLSRADQHYTDIFEHPEYFTALLGMLAAQGAAPPAAALGVLHGEATLAPPLDDYWLSVFLERALRRDAYFETDTGKTLLRPYRRLFTGMGDGNFTRDNPADRLAAITEIVTAESEDMLDALRLVVLTDHIHAAFRPTTVHDRRPLDKVGTVPVFEALRRREDAYFRGDLAVLTGSLIVIPRTAESRLLELAYAALPTERVIRTQPWFPDSEYVTVDTGGLSNKHGVGWITQLFTEGRVKVIVGTRSLLGEGWDAPVVNSLILANTVGSFVLSNQMRGRAIRTVRDQPGKVANIWHPVVVHPAVSGGGADVERLRRRFRAFAGPRLEGKAAIQNGLGRFGLGDTYHPESEADMLRLRERSLALATRRSVQADRWTRALAGGRQLVEAIRPPAETYYRKKDPLTLHYRESGDRALELEYRLFLLEAKVATIVAVAGTALTAALVTVPAVVGLPLLVIAGGLAVGNHRYFSELHRLMLPRLAGTDRNPAFDAELSLAPYALVPLVFTALFMLLAPASSPVLPLLYFGYLSVHRWRNGGKVRRTADHHAALLGDPLHRLRAYGKALAGTLEAREIFHEATAGSFRVEQEDGDHFAYLHDAEHHDNQLFATALAELMAPPDNPRYLLRLEPPEGWSTGEYYLPVPDVLGNKAGAGQLARALSIELRHPFLPVYTREPAGRLHLLAARLRGSGREAGAAGEREMLWR